MTVRKAVFWLHLAAGLTSGVVVFIMSFTGAALALQPQILLWAERDVRRVQPPTADSARLGPDALVASVRAAHPSLAVTGLTMEHDRTQAAAVTTTDVDAPPARGPAPQTTLYVDPYTGAVLGRLDPTTAWRRFFRITTDWHRWLAMSGDQRTTGRWITGISNAAFLVLCVTGVYIWLPRVWSSSTVRAVMFFRRGLSGKARDFNWHNVIGVWSAAVLVVLTFTGMCISFPKTYDVIDSLTGLERPPAPPNRPNGPAGRPEEGRPGGASVPAPPPANLDLPWSIAEAQLPTWRSISLRLPQRASDPLTFTMNDRERRNPMARSTLTVDPMSAEVIRWEPYESLKTGQRLRTWMRFGHTGELWGVPGQIVAGLASAGACVLVYTGFALAWRRWTAWRGRRRRRSLDPATLEMPAA